MLTAQQIQTLISCSVRITVVQNHGNAAAATDLS